MSKRIGLASTSNIKIEAVENAFNKIYPDIEIITRSTKSDINEQPIGFTEIITGAQNRMNHLVEILSFSPKVDFYVSIENGLIQISDNKWLDIAWVILMDSTTNKKYEGSSGGILFDKESVDESRKIGWNTTTAGSIMAKTFNCDSVDPHSFITGNRVGRRELISQTLFGLIGEYEKHISICNEILQNWKMLSPNCNKDAQFMKTFYEMYAKENKYSGYRKLTDNEMEEFNLI